MSLCMVASYPKSGNTWMRALLTALCSPDGFDDLHDLSGSNRSAYPSWVSAEIGVDATMLSIDQLDVARAALYRRRNASVESLEFEKTHLVNRELPGQRRVFDAATGRAIYIVRHPFDVAVSYSHFVGLSIDEIATQMLNIDAVIDRPGGAWRGLLPQFMSSWSEHVRSWIEPSEVPTIVVRFEDMLEDTAAQLRRVADFVGFATSSEDLDTAVDAARFDRLQQLESGSGFELSPVGREAFFRSGRTGEGTERLSTEQCERIVADAAKQMEQLGYHPDGATGTLER